MCSIQVLQSQLRRFRRSLSRLFEQDKPKNYESPSPKTESPPEIAILGAGIGGLALAIGLIRRGVPVTIYEAAEEFAAIGAGIGFGPNSLTAIDLLDPRFRQMYEDAATPNERAEFANSVFDALYAEEGFGQHRGWTRGLIGAPYFTRSSAHRKDLLSIMESLVPPGVVQFSKRAEQITQEGKQVTVKFEDGEVIKVDALIGCDGIKGTTRATVLSASNPEQVAPTYCNMYIYRGIIPMEDAKTLLGEHAGDAKWFMAKEKGVAIYPISKGKAENFVFFIMDKKGWTGPSAAIPCSKSEMIADLEGFDPRLIKLLDWASPLRWPTFHHPKTATYVKGRVCLCGDVAHATSPHQAAGAGQGLEDAVVLSRLLALVKSSHQLDAAFEVYDRIRRPRAQKVVKTSYEAGEIYTWTNPEILDNMQKIVENANERLHWIWQHELAKDAERAEQEFLSILKRNAKSRTMSSLKEVGIEQKS